MRASLTARDAAVFMALLVLSGCARPNGGPGIESGVSAPTLQPVAPQALATKPAVHADQALVDLGDQFWERELPVSFTLLNDGARTATIAAVDASCKCTVASEKYVGRAIEPGESMPIQFTLSTGEYPGEVFRSVEFTLDDETKVHVDIRANVVSTYQLSRGRMDFGQVDTTTEELVSDTVIFSSERAKIVDVDPTRDWVEATVTELDDHTSEIHVTLRTDRLPNGRNKADIVVQTDDPFRALTTVGVIAEGYSALRAFPAHVFLRPEGEQTVRFFDHGGQAVRLAAADVAGPELASTLTDEGALRLKALAQWNGPMRITVRDEQQQTGTVLIRYMPSRGS